MRPLIFFPSRTFSSAKKGASNSNESTAAAKKAIIMSPKVIQSCNHDRIINNLFLPRCMKVFLQPPSHERKKLLLSFWLIKFYYRNINCCCNYMWAKEDQRISISISSLYEKVIIPFFVLHGEFGIKKIEPFHYHNAWMAQFRNLEFLVSGYYDSFSEVWIFTFNFQSINGRQAIIQYCIL